MRKLKTLKDFNIYYSTICKKHPENGEQCGDNWMYCCREVMNESNTVTKEGLDIKELQETAKEWIKELEHNAYSDSNEPFAHEYSDGRKYCNGAIKWIEHFFNLEES